MALTRAAAGSWYGSYHGRAAMIRPNPDGTWRVKVNDPTNRLAGHDGWMLVGADDYPTADAAAADTGVV
jgi:hypothetical protein